MENRKTHTGKFTKGNAFGKGRPPSKIVCLREQFGEQGQREFNQRMYELAMEGESSAIKYIGDRLYPTPKPQRHIEHVSLQNIKTEEEIDLAMVETLNLVSTGELSLEEGLDVAQLIEKRGVMILNNEIRQLDEEKMRDKNEYSH